MGTPLPPVPPRPSPKAKKRPKLICPGKNESRPFFSIPCKTAKECTQLGNKNMLCCNNRCLKGVPAPSPEPVHSPTLFGLVQRVCPTELIPEIFEIKRCSEDSDCSPRICCPEKMLNGDIVGYCRTPEAKLDNIPGVRQFVEPFRLMMNYMQCTPPPPPILDVFPKECRYPLDCFPNLCCQERGKRYCRPPRRSLLTLLTTVAQRIVPTETAREIINRIAP
ncbi:uncharacterized protein LOC103313831 [Tribolium castaneum]|uniref:WAP domain-containing protein n=1 Tax=Tribolium castaneum TaxID=7070 RepID=D6WSP9_TRICA|nr:PREDICTED: uncharacterized protein LOC103313831 [Tribolium castaneum]EFA05886.2 hypothetical protein TcasGA2_TC008698 [Tribolium castaneum]|eukprot:XP_015837666.1 PREDICTED: uncharacterized protein LOC103313831 [Tribolium castaneum]